MLKDINQYEAPPLLREFLIYTLTIRGLSPKTVEGYYIDLRFFLRYLKAIRRNCPMDEHKLSDITISDITKEEICNVTVADAYGFLNFTMTGENQNSAAARCRKISSIRAFYRYLSHKAHYMDDNPMEQLETPQKKKSLPIYMSLNDSKTLLNAIDGNAKERDFCMITFFLNCGMRVSELVGLKVSSFLSNDDLRILGKGNKERIVHLNRACSQARASYDAVRKPSLKNKSKNGDEPYFLSSRGTALTTRRVEQILNHHLQTAGLSGQGITPHKLRHTAATLMYQYGHVDIRVLKEILGHVNLGTTEIYTHVSNQQIAEATDASPLANMEPPAPEKKGDRRENDIANDLSQRDKKE